MIKPLPPSTPLDPEIEIKLPLSAWQSIFEQLTHGSCEDFAAILYTMVAQTAPQTEAATRALLEPNATGEVQKAAESISPLPPTLN